MARGHSYKAAVLWSCLGEAPDLWAPLSPANPRYLPLCAPAWMLSRPPLAQAEGLCLLGSSLGPTEHTGAHGDLGPKLWLVTKGFFCSILSSMGSSPLGTGEIWWPPQWVAGALVSSQPSSTIEIQSNTYLHKLHAAVQGGFLTKEQKEVFILRQEHSGKLQKWRDIAVGDTGQCPLGKSHCETCYRAEGLGFLKSESSDCSSVPWIAMFDSLILSNSIAPVLGMKHCGYLPSASFRSRIIILILIINLSVFTMSQALSYDSLVLK